MKKKNRNIGIIISVLVLIGMILFCIKYFWSNKPSESKNETEISESVTEEPIYAGKRFDMNNTENARITGNIKQNISNKLLEERMYLDLKISDITLESDASTGVTTFMAMVENLSDSTHSEELVHIILLKKDGSELATIDGVIGELKKGEKTELTSYTGTDLANAYDFKIEKVQ